jgi:glutamate-1-semialdehyde aminotransferase
MSQSLLSTQEIMCAETMKAKIAALAHRFWSIHPSTIAAMNLTCEEFYAREMTKLLASETDRLRVALESIANKCPATCDMTLAHEMAQEAEEALRGERA